MQIEPESYRASQIRHKTYLSKENQVFRVTLDNIQHFRNGDLVVWYPQYSDFRTELDFYLFLSLDEHRDYSKCLRVLRLKTQKIEEIDYYHHRLFRLMELELDAAMFEEFGEPVHE